MILRSLLPISWVLFGTAVLSKGQRLDIPPCPKVNISYAGCPYGLANQCREDYECSSNMRCCGNKCGRRMCVDTAEKTIKPAGPKSGSCPEVETRGPCIADHDYCRDDSNCLGQQKCCPSATCSQKCVLPDEARRTETPARPGTCPQPSNDDLCEMDEPPECTVDNDCATPEKCCNNGCTRLCVQPDTEEQVLDQDAPKLGVCPFVVGSDNCSRDAARESECSHDSDCMGEEKCCKDTCEAMRCVEVEAVALFSSHNKDEDKEDEEEQREEIEEEPTEPQEVSEKLGSCPVDLRMNPGVPCKGQQDECADNSQCAGDSKCCSDGCVKRCVSSSRIEAGRRASITCHKKYMVVDVSKEEFDKYGVSHLTLSDSSCLATSNETHYSIRAPLVGCGTVSRHTSETVIYSNQIINRIGESVVTRAQEFQMPFSCFYTKEGVTSTNGLIPRKILTVFDGGNGTTNFVLGMALFKTENYLSPYGQEDFPLRVVLNKPVFIQVAVESPDTRLAVRAHQCYATPTENPASLIKYNIIDDGCSRDPTVRFYENPAPDVQRFSFKAFQFIGQGQQFVFLHCHLVVCNASNPLSECARSCDDESGLGRHRRAVLAVPARSLTEGPVIVTIDQKALRQEQKRESSIKISMWVMIGMGVLCVLSLAGVFYLKRQMSRGAQPKEDHVPESRV